MTDFKIKNNCDMKNIITKYDEIVIYGAGNMGQAVIKNLKERGWEDKIVCCTVTDYNGNIRKVLDIQVVELRWLLHLRETACFIIAVAENKQTEMYENLVQFGCKYIKVIEYSYALELQFAQKVVASYTRGLEEKVIQLQKKMDRIEYQIQEQNEVCATNIEAFKNFKNCNYGKDIVIVASGPTMKYYVPKMGALHIGVNFTWKRNDIVFNYFFIQDGNRKGKYLEMLNGAFENVKGDIFIGRYLRSCLRREIEYPVLVNVKETRIHRYWVESFDADIYQNICYHTLMNYSTVVFPALQFALYTYPKRIYLVGCDASNQGDFDTKEYPFPYWQLNILKCGYAMIKEFANQYYPETEIISVNPIGLKDLFHDTYTDEFLNGKEIYNAQ